MPIDTGMTFVVLTHRRENAPSWLVEILSKATTMHVEEIVDGSIFEANSVHIVPGGQDLTIDGHAFCLAPARKKYGLPDIFDTYLRSVAATTYGRAVTVILSGLARDGAAFLGALRHAGGINYAQKDAFELSMPRSAIQTGMVDYVGSPQEIAEAVLELPPTIKADRSCRKTD
jgi:two-component system CheB/CheR fusion protein